MEIHSTVPVRKTKGRLVRELRSILPQITGREHVKSAPEIMQLVGQEAVGTCQPLRMAAKILLVEEGIPVVSISKGFFVATKPRELIEYQTHLRARMEGLQRDVDAVEKCLFSMMEKAVVRVKPKKFLFEMREKAE